jgi:hypothetical protein
MSNREQLAIDDWEEVVTALEQFGAPQTSVSDEQVTLGFDHAHLTVARDGTVDAGMPLHTTEATVNRIIVDHTADAISLLGPDITYTFRRP